MSLRVWRLEVSAYLAMLYLGCVAGVFAGAAVAEASGLDATSFALVTVGLLVPAFAGARLWFVLQHPDLFRAEPSLVWRRSDGGSSLYGGLVLALLVSVPVLALAGLPFWSFWDAASVTMLVGLIATRFGCLMNGCCGGRVRGVPTQLLEAGLAALILCAALALRTRLGGDGVLFAGVVGSYAAGRLVLDRARDASDPTHLNDALSAALLAASIALLATGALL